MRRLLASLIVASLANFALIGCSKKEESAPAPKTEMSGASAFLSDPLLAKLPTSTELFYVVNASGDAYRRLQTSPWARSSSGLGSLQQAIDQMTAAGADPAQIAGLQVALSTLQNLGLVSPNGQSTVDQVLSKAVFFAGLSDSENEPLQAGMYFSAAKGASLKSKLPVLRQLLGDADMVVAEQKIGGIDGLVARPAQQPQDTPQEIAIYLAATDSLMAISLTRSGAESLFSSTNTDTVKLISETPQFKKAASSVGVSPDSIAFGYLDVQKLVPVILKIAAKNGAVQDDQADLRNLPVDSIAIGQSYDKQIVSALGVAVSSRSDNQSKLFSALEGASIPANLAKLPSDTAFAFGLDTRFIAKASDLLASLQDQQSAAALQQAKDLQGVTFGVRNGDGSSPLPDVYLVFNAANRDTFATTAESLIGEAMSSAAGVAPQWSSKDVDGTPTKFIMTMIGAGVYLSSPKDSNSLVVASSERAVRDVLQASAGQKGGIADSLQASLKDSFSAAKLGSVYFNAIQTASLLDSVKSSVAMFAGPSPELEQALNTENLKRLGLATGSISYSNGLFLVESAFDASAGAGN